MSSYGAKGTRTPNNRLLSRSGRKEFLNVEPSAVSPSLFRAEVSRCTKLGDLENKHRFVALKATLVQSRVYFSISQRDFSLRRAHIVIERRALARTTSEGTPHHTNLEGYGPASM